MFGGKLAEARRQSFHEAVAKGGSLSIRGVDGGRQNGELNLRRELRMPQPVSNPLPQRGNRQHTNSQTERQGPDRSQASPPVLAFPRSRHPGSVCGNRQSCGSVLGAGAARFERREDFARALIPPRGLFFKAPVDYGAESRRD